MTSYPIVVIGGSGFIGTRLVRRLLALGHEVRIFDLEESKAFPELCRRGDVRDQDQLLAACQGCEVIVNLAAAHRDDVRPISLYHEVNVGGAEITIKVAEELGIKTILFTSTVAVYGFTKIPLGEEAPGNPINPYGQSKLDAEGVFRGWQEFDSARSLVIIRPTVVFGEGNRGNVYNLMRQIASNHFFMVGEGSNRKSMAYVENIANALAFLLESGPGCHIYNYADKPDFAMNDLVRTIKRALGHRSEMPLRLPYGLVYLAGGLFDLLARITKRSFPISRVRVEKFCANTEFKADKIFSSGFQPDVDLAAALKRTVESEFSD
jgi:nucleoside-diphosphate-sugar epimerase